MTESMTGFGSAEQGGVRVEVRSLNHRYLEVQVKCPPALAAVEVQLRKLIREGFSRGKFDVFISLSKEAAPRIRLDHGAAREVYDAIEGLRQELGLAGGVELGHMLMWREAFMAAENGQDISTPALSAFEVALGLLRTMRRAEGGALKAEIMERLLLIEAANERILGLGPTAAQAARRKFQVRLDELLKETPVDQGMVLSEASTLAEKADITEEVMRVRVHVAQMRQALEEGGTVGRKLDFLLQELNREANTMGSKSTDTEIMDSVIELKSEIERVREQVQNIQ